MDSFPMGDGIDAETFFTRSVYTLMIVGSYPSPLGPRREVRAADLEPLGVWQSCADSEPPMGVHLLEGAYANMDGEWHDAVLPAWYHADHCEWECDDGEFTEPRHWMLMPWLPEVWQAAAEYRARERARFDAQREARQAAQNN